MAKLKNSIKNIEGIIKEIKKKTKSLKSLTKLDGITIECTIFKNSNIDAIIEEIKEICSNIIKEPISTELNDVQSDTFIIQFPELEPEYTDKEIEKMYKDNFKWLLDNFLQQDIDNNFDKNKLATDKNIFVKQAILYYYRSNTNQYKEKVENFLNNLNYRNKIDSLYLQFLNDYEIKR